MLKGRYQKENIKIEAKHMKFNAEIFNVIINH